MTVSRKLLTELKIGIYDMVIYIKYVKYEYIECIVPAVIYMRKAVIACLLLICLIIICALIYYNAIQRLQFEIIRAKVASVELNTVE